MRWQEIKKTSLPSQQRQQGIENTLLEIKKTAYLQSKDLNHKLLITCFYGGEIPDGRDKTTLQSWPISSKNYASMEYIIPTN